MKALLHDSSKILASHCGSYIGIFTGPARFHNKSWYRIISGAARFVLLGGSRKIMVPAGLFSALLSHENV